MSESDRRRGGLIPFRIPLPNPLAWLPRPRLGRPRKRNFASTSVAISESVLGGASVTCTITTTSAGSASASVPSSAPSAPPAKVPLKPASDVVCGALARAASQSTIHPLDTLKVRLQARKGGMPPGVSKFGQLVPPAGVAPRRVDLAQVGKTVASLYKGVCGAASGAGIAIGTYFAFYGAACNVLSRQTDLPPSGVAFCAGGIAAMGSSVVKVPLAVCIRSVQAGVYPNVFDACRSIVAQAGWRGLFTGFLPTLLEDVPDMAIKFAAYEAMRQVHSRFHKGRSASPQEDFAMGAVAGAMAAAATTPLDVIKTNMMCAAASRPTMMEAARMVYAQGGPNAFFRGIGPRALSNGINSAVFFAFFEALRGAVANAKRQGLWGFGPAPPSGQLRSGLAQQAAGAQRNIAVVAAGEQGKVVAVRR
uniref:Mitochondrial carrier protein n=1 Tax=Chlamydomonas leiostraca TaxID=1034604 RepID=A0A7S0S2B4_9CHLO|mmetsp:Transcript_37348/g.94199  ORF Transcript_37348/g.94199 Transcript_37348/m.94199 type:complete len:420 (+) Transcript_37348:857-2116(+)|eukprot:CAMPEP_0202864058 /NCGR_PEP_ID=MMETSP1391-20130828/4453_1 /ASSEMBLY_ACC=CAM_ASM_000867 /TAXON_ID=1034604 /ORGANISM="Chlamydomonas leiostraca, Strain SAG 11-49" /LENGTH=419 /DNA_ID=CAMNT_0049543763 /DNA_START=790 /DNA_END=2049 /DNA_ORIENTATION=+